MPRPLRLPMALLFLTAWGIPLESQSVPALQTDLPRALSSAELRLVDGANAFTFDLLRPATRTLPAEFNVFLSPLSAGMALSMALNGANGETGSSRPSRTRVGPSSMPRSARWILGVLRQWRRSTNG